MNHLRIVQYMIIMMHQEYMKSSKITKEFELLLCCARSKIDSETSDRIVSLVSEGLDWEYLFSMADQHKLKPLLYWHLNNIFSGDILPQEEMEDLKNFFQANTRKNLLYWGKLLNILRLLEENGITAVSFKGPELAFSAYNNLALRSFQDIDIILRPEKVSEVKELLSTIGYKPEMIISQPMEKKFIKYQKEYMFFNKDEGITLDLHWRFTWLFLPKSSSFNFLDENILETVEISKSDIKTVPPENMFLILCLHNYTHYWSKLSLLVDLVEFTNNHSLDWLIINEMAEQLQIKKITLINLNLLHEILGFDTDLLGKEFNRDLHSKKIKEISTEIKDKIYFPDKFEETKLLTKFFNNIKFRDTLSAGLMDCFKDLFIPTNFELTRIALPPILFPLYHLIRPFLLLIRYQI